MHAHLLDIDVAFTPLLHNGLSKDTHEQELADCVLNRLKHAGLIEFDLPSSVKRLDQPLDLIVEEVLIMRLMTIVVGDEVN